MKERKKFRYGISILMVLMFALIPFSSALAYEGGLLDNKSVFLIKNDGTVAGLTTNLTDNDTTTYSRLSQSDNIKNFEYTFEQPFNITEFRINVNASSYLVVRFTDIDNKVNNYDVLSTNGFVQDVSLSNIKKVEVVYSGSNYVNVREFNVYGNTSDISIPPLEVTNLSETHTDTTATLNWNLPNDDSIEILRVYKDGVNQGNLNKTATTHTFNDLLPNTSYTFKVTTINSNNIESAGKTITVTTNETPVETIPPGNITNLQSNITFDSISFTFDNPIDEDFSLVKVYKDGVLHGHTSDGTYQVTNLDAGKQYSFKFTSVDVNGNESSGLITSLTTSNYVDDIPPNAPTGVEVINGSGSLMVKYDANTEQDLAGYNIYVDGVKVNATLVTGRSYTMSGLENDTSYNIQVTAVDTSANESGMSSIAIGTPNSDAVPLLTMSYSLVDVADSVGSWFSEIWLIIAFSVAIPLTFYISGRTKLLFLD